MANESKLRTTSWLMKGCNAFDVERPTSRPMSFWTEQDVLEYIKTNNLPICSVYGDIVEDFSAKGQVDGQISLLSDAKPTLRLTGCQRTGCMMCGFGCHLAKKGEGNFERVKETHPKMYGLLDICKNNGVTFREAIEWTNEHGNLNIRL
jgi:3'-phosphoadenosine 5'-phosphosulfate sulfotransferase (PAPS reductase)/FAD synthetase